MAAEVDTKKFTKTSLSPAMQQCLAIHEAMLKMKDSEMFRTPVPWKELRLEDYPKIIKQPMDLGTVGKRLKRGQFANPSKFADDMRLIWTNCMTYNLDGSAIYNVAAKQLKAFEDKFAKAHFELNKTPTMDSMIQFSKDLQRISHVQLGKVVEMLDKTCPACLSCPAGAEEIEISIDDIDATTMGSVVKFIKQCFEEEEAAKKKQKKTEAAHKTKKAKIESAP